MPKAIRTGSVKPKKKKDDLVFVSMPVPGEKNREYVYEMAPWLTEEQREEVMAYQEERIKHEHEEYLFEKENKDKSYEQLYWKFYNENNRDIKCPHCETEKDVESSRKEKIESGFLFRTDTELVDIYKCSNCKKEFTREELNRVREYWRDTQNLMAKAKTEQFLNKMKKT